MSDTPDTPDEPDEVVTRFKGPGQWRSQAKALEAEAEPDA